MGDDVVARIAREQEARTGPMRTSTSTERDG